MIRQTTRRIRWSDVRDRLKPREAAIEIVRMTSWVLGQTGTDSSRCVALLLRSSWKTPRLVQLPGGARTETTLAPISQDEARQRTDDWKVPYKTLWQPIAQALGPVTRVFVALDGIYQLINVPNLLNRRTGKHLLDEVELMVLPSTADLLESPRPATNRVAELLGHPAFQTSNQPGGASSPTQMLRSRTGQEFSELPYTKLEVE